MDSETENLDNPSSQHENMIFLDPLRSSRCGGFLFPPQGSGIHIQLAPVCELSGDFIHPGGAVAIREILVNLIVLCYTTS